MKNSVKSLLVAVAMTGLLGATALPVAAQDSKPASSDSTKDTSKTTTNKKAKSKKASTTSDKDSGKTATSKDKNSCKSANGCSSK